MATEDGRDTGTGSGTGTDPGTIAAGTGTDDGTGGGGAAAVTGTGTLGYEQARDELIEVVRRLETGGTSLEESLELWERGEELARVCRRWLDGARARLDAALAAQDPAREGRTGRPGHGGGTGELTGPAGGAGGPGDPGAGARPGVRRRDLARSAGFRHGTEAARQDKARQDNTTRAGAGQTGARGQARGPGTGGRGRPRGRVPPPTVRTERFQPFPRPPGRGRAGRVPPDIRPNRPAAVSPDAGPPGRRPPGPDRLGRRIRPSDPCRRAPGRQTPGFRAFSAPASSASWSCGAVPVTTVVTPSRSRTSALYLAPE